MFKTKLFISLIFLLSISINVEAQIPDVEDTSQISFSSDRLIELEKKLIKSENSQESKKLIDDIKIEANKNLFLFINGKVYSASAIFTCQKLAPNFECSGASDAEHIENITTKAISDKISSISAQINPDYHTSTYQFYLAQGETSKRTIPVVVDDTLKIKIKGKKVLFAIVKGKGELFYKKYVWVIGS